MNTNILKSPFFWISISILFIIIAINVIGILPSKKCPIGQQKYPNCPGNICGDICSDGKIFNQDLIQIFSIVLVIFNILELVYAVQLQFSNKSSCKTGAWIPLLWIIPSILIIYLIFLIINANIVKSDIEKMF